MSRYLSLVIFLVIALGGGTLIGVLTSPGPWFDQLDKPSFNPPSWVFGPVWSVLYIMIGVAGWRIWLHGRRTPATWLWGAQMALNFLWSPVFFAAHEIGLALIIILAMLATILSFIALAWRRDRLAALLFLPYAAWVTFASALNTGFYLMN